MMNKQKWVSNYNSRMKAKRILGGIYVFDDFVFFNVKNIIASKAYYRTELSLTNSF